MKGAISVGSHYGEEYEGWLSQGATNFVFIEPVIENFVKLQRIMSGKDGIKLFNCAIGNGDGVSEMYIETEHQGKSCSVLEPLLHLDQYPDIRFTRKEKVEMKKLDSLDINLVLYDHLHIDTQGYEMEVLKGAEWVLKCVDTIQIEVYRKELYRGCAMYQDILLYLIDRGFDQESVYWRGNTWGDAFFRKSNL